MNIKLVIFDLDGTLLNTITDLALSVNHALEKFGYPTHPIEKYKQFVGNGVAKLIERATPEKYRTPEILYQVEQEYLKYYNKHDKDNTNLYDGIAQMFEELKKRNIKIAVASNKHHSATVELIDHYFGLNNFEVVYGKRDNVPAKPDPTVVFDILKVCGITATEVVYVGDTSTDMQTATNANVCSVGVTWGFRSKEELLANNAMHIIDNPIDLLKIID